MTFSQDKAVDMAGDRAEFINNTTRVYFAIIVIRGINGRK
jgi:hypothetical protein